MLNKANKLIKSNSNLENNNQNYKPMFNELINELLKLENPNSTKINQIKINLSKKYNFKGIIKNAQIIANSNEDNREEIIKILNIKPVRELSGVTVVALFAKPHSCPHGKCIYCPGGPGSPFGDTPQSYTGKEPAAMRAIRNNYDPYLQIFNRLEHYCINGHIPDKLELIFMGGTFPSLEKNYRDEFVYFVYKAINDFSTEFIETKKEKKKINYEKFNEFFEVKENKLQSIERQNRIHSKILKLKQKSNLNIGIDIDEVLIFTWDEVLKRYNKKFNKNLKFKDIKNFNFNDDENLEKEFYSYFKEMNLNHAPHQNSLEILKKLKDDGHNLYLITSRKEWQINKTIEWINKHFEPNFFKDILFTSIKNDLNKDKNESKNTLKGDYLINNKIPMDIVIEDAKHHIENYVKHQIPTIIFTQNWNKDIDINEINNKFNLDLINHPIIYRTNNWDEILNIINNFSKEDNFKKEIRKNEISNIRSIGLTIETKPDWALEEHCNMMLEYGTTRVEVGVQTLNEECLKKTNRGHGLKETKKAFQVMKDMCFKINAHMMIGLPNSNLKIDEESLINLFKLPDYRPDMLKIYPCLVSKGTPLYKMWEKGLFKPIETNEAAKIIARAYKYFPRYVRVMRVQRDIPTPNIDAGVKNSNLRQYVETEMKELNIKPKDIRSREVGFKILEGKKLGEFKLEIEKYNSSKGIDFYIDVVDENDYLIGFIRLRFPYEIGLRKEINEKTALIRELHVYGIKTPVGDEGDFQHRGWGRKLLKKAEEIAKENNYNNIAIISGIGVREYYRKFGYELEGVYMTKKL